MTEATPTEAQNQELDIDLSTPQQDLVTDCQAHVALKPGPKPRRNRRITVEGSGRVVGRDATPILSADVFKLAAIGCKDTEIAEWFGIDPNTLRYNFSVELLKGRETLKHSLRRKQIQVAMSGNPTMLIWLGKNLLAQSDSPGTAGDHQALPWSDDQ